jgi:hypothetical protein
MCRQVIIIIIIVIVIVVTIIHIHTTAAIAHIRSTYAHASSVTSVVYRTECVWQ